MLHAAATAGLRGSLGMMKCSYIFVSNKCFDLIYGQRQKSSQDKSRNKEDAFFTVCLTSDNAAAWGHLNKGAAVFV